MLNLAIGLIIGLVWGWLLGLTWTRTLVKRANGTVKRVYKELEEALAEKAQFIDPVSGKEKFSKAENITDLTDER